MTDMLDSAPATDDAGDPFDQLPENPDAGGDTSRDTDVEALEPVEPDSSGDADGTAEPASGTRRRRRRVSAPRDLVAAAHAALRISQLPAEMRSTASEIFKRSPLDDVDDLDALAELGALVATDDERRSTAIKHIKALQADAANPVRVAIAVTKLAQAARLEAARLLGLVVDGRNTDETKEVELAEFVARCIGELDQAPAELKALLDL